MARPTPFLRPVLRIVLPHREWIDVRRSGVVKTSLPIDGAEDRLLLLFWGRSDEARFRNVVRVDPHGNVVWRATLPGDAPHDCFVHLEERRGGYLARTFSGLEMWLRADGQADVPVLTPSVATG